VATSILRFTVGVGALCAACGSNSKSTADAKQGDAIAENAVVTVSCTGITPAATVTINATGDGYQPATTNITQGQVVLFMTNAFHNVTPGHSPPDSAVADPGIAVDFNKQECRMFTAPGNFGFHCSVHLFNGTISVQ
jgi:plastocyanin